MSDQLIITLGREFGSGGHAIAVELANRYGIKLYDHNLFASSTAIACPPLPNSRPNVIIN